MLDPGTFPQLEKTDWDLAVDYESKPFEFSRGEAPAPKVRATTRSPNRISESRAPVLVSRRARRLVAGHFVRGGGLVAALGAEHGAAAAALMPSLRRRPGDARPARACRAAAQVGRGGLCDRIGVVATARGAEGGRDGSGVGVGRWTGGRRGPSIAVTAHAGWTLRASSWADHVGRTVRLARSAAKVDGRHRRGPLRDNRPRRAGAGLRAGEARPAAREARRSARVWTARDAVRGSARSFAGCLGGRTPGARPSAYSRPAAAPARRGARRRGGGGVRPIMRLV